MEIDEEFMQDTVRTMRGILGSLEEGIDDLADKDNDIFERYYNFHLLNLIFKQIGDITFCTKAGFQVGLNFTSERFDGSKRDERGWNTPFKNSDPFFKDESEDDEPVSSHNAEIAKKIMKQLGIKT